MLPPFIGMQPILFSAPSSLQATLHFSAGRLAEEQQMRWSLFSSCLRLRQNRTLSFALPAALLAWRPPTFWGPSVLGDEREQLRPLSLLFAL